MAEDCRISTDFPNHHKTVMVKRRLGIVGCWHLMCLFLYAANRKWNGDLTGMSDEEIEIAAGWDGKSGEFVSALIECKYLEGEPNNRLIHDWAEHNPYAADRGKRIKKARKAAAKRWDAKRNAKSCSEHASSMPQHQSSNAPSTPSTQLNSAENKTKTIDASVPAERDSRFTPVKDFIKKCCEYKQTLFVWDGSEGNALKSFLRAAGKDMSTDAVCALVRNYYNQNPAPDRPRIWLGNLGKYATKVRSNGKQQTYADRNQQSVIDAVRSSIAADSRLDQEATGDASDSARPADNKRTIDAVRGETPKLQAVSASNRV